jgi:hypothetical protein
MDYTRLGATGLADRVIVGNDNPYRPLASFTAVFGGFISGGYHSFDFH